MDTVLLKQRDRYSVELKARHGIGASTSGRRGLRAYLFFPKAFNISSGTYWPGDFFGQLKLNLRFNTPRFSVEEVLQPLTDASPLIRLEKMLYRLTREEQAIDERFFLYESKMLACVYKSILRSFFYQIREKLTGTPAEGYLEEHLEQDVKKLHEVARRYHAILQDLRKQGVTGDLLQQARMLDEHISLLLEKYLASILPLCTPEDQRQLYQRIAKVLFKEERHRQKEAYPSLPSANMRESQLEEYIYREKMLKKYASEVLFFDVKRKDSSKRAEHILYALAAGLAMVLATSIAFFGQTRYGSLTTSLFVLLVIGYMVKDRVKDLFRDVLRRRVGRYMSDRKTRIYDRRKRKRLATVAERANFLSERQLPDSIRSLRNRGYFERALSDQEEERVLLYSKSIRLDERNIRNIHNRINGVAEINVIDLRPFMKHLTAQYGLVPRVPQKQRVELKRVKRIYHLNLIVAYHSPEGEMAGRFRLIVDAGGIKRIEPVELTGPGAGEEFRLVLPSLRDEDGEFDE